MVEKMNELIPIEKERRVERELAEQGAEKDRERQKAETQKYRPFH